MKYPKPKQFSDPYCDWMGCEDQLKAILKKSDDSLTTDDFRVIFAKHLPAANYREGAYYIEKCIDWFSVGREIKESRLPEGFFWWLENFKDELRKDNLLTEVKQMILTGVYCLLDDFELFDLDQIECDVLGRDFRWSISPFNQNTVRDIFDEITIGREFETECDAIVDKLIGSNEISHIRWFVEIAAHSRDWGLLYNEDFLELDDYVKKESIFHKLHHFPIMQKKYSIAMELARAEGKEKYNNLVSPYG